MNRPAMQEFRPIAIVAVAASLAAITRPPVWAQAVAPRSAATEEVPFTSERWAIQSGTMTRLFDRDCFVGIATLDDVEFRDGVIEVDVAITGDRSYPGVLFRMQSDRNYERFYIRPHRGGLYPDALQYTPVFNGVAGWQLYSGPGFTAAAVFPENEWFPIRLEIQGSQSRVFINNEEQPGLAVSVLKHGVSTGGIGVMGPTDGTACFSNFSYSTDEHLQFPPPPEPAPSIPGTITSWEVSRIFPAARVNRDQYPHFYTIFRAGWETVPAEPNGLLDIARYRQRSGGAEMVFARTIVQSVRRQEVTLSFGYSDDIDLFLNGRKIFAGRSGYRYRDPSFAGIIGLFDDVRLTLEPGRNEIFAMVTESFGGWGLMGRADAELSPPARDHSRVTRVWQTDDVFLTPESVLYDRARNVLYVTSFDTDYQRRSVPAGFVSRVGLDGSIIELHWVTGLLGPAGMALRGDRLYVAERTGLTVIDVTSGTVIERHEIPGSEFLNDISFDGEGNIYISDTSPSAWEDSRIYRFAGGAFEVWADGPEISRSNGLFVHGGEVLLGNSGDGSFKAIDLETRAVRNVIALGAGISDGVRVDNGGNYIFSQWEGLAYLVSPTGELTEILDTRADMLNAADFEFIPEQNLLIVPTFLGNRVTAYRLNRM